MDARKAWKVIHGVYRVSIRRVSGVTQMALGFSPLFLIVSLNRFVAGSETYARRRVVGGPFGKLRGKGVNWIGAVQPMRE